MRYGPWQHVLESLSGYLWLGARLLRDGHRYDGAWNFGPAPDAAVPVADVVREFVAAYGAGSWRVAQPAADGAGEALHEARLLLLDCEKSREELGWAPVWDAPEAIRRTAAWYRAWADGRTGTNGSRDTDGATRAAELRAALESDIAAYVEAAGARGLPWVAAAATVADGGPA